jgi:DNA-binding NarL/FixJ family response regulator
MITVLLADDQELVRSGIEMILEAQEDLTIVASVSNGEAAYKEAVELKPDLAILDIEMPGGDGITAARRILEDARLTTRVVMLTTFDSTEYVYDALRAGVSGFLLKSAPRAHLLHAARTAVSGEALLDPTLTRSLVESAVRPRPSADAVANLESLTEREREIFGELARGRSNAEIAADLFLAPATVKTHVAAVLRKLELRDRVQAVVLGYESGVVRPGG